MSFKKTPLYLKIIIGMLLGTILGVVSIKLGFENSIKDWVAPFGTIFMNLLKLIAVPLIFVSLITGITGLKDVSKLSSMGGKTIVLYIVSTVIAISIGLVLVNIIKPGDAFPDRMKTEMVKEFSDKVTSKQEIAAERKAQGPLQFLVDLVPSNIIAASSKNNKMLQVIFFAVMFGISIILLPESKTKTVIKFFDELNNVILKFIDIIMKFAPYGVFALLAALIADIAGGNPKDTIILFKGLGLYSLTVIIGLLLMIFVVYPILLKLFSKIKYRKFIKGIFPAQLMAFSTSSSAATLPITMEQAEKEVGISKETAGFVLPIGATINMDGTSLYQAVAAVFIAQVFGYDLDLGQQLTIVLTATLASIGSAAVPGAGIVMLVIVLESIGVPSSGIALIFAVDRILDMFRTAVNVTGDTTVAAIVDSKK